MRLAVKLYKTSSRNQPYKLEFQMEVPGKDKGGQMVPVNEWENAIRVTGQKLMDAFLEFCNVKNTIISSGQAGKVRELPRLPYDPKMLSDLIEIKERPSIAGPAMYIEDQRRKLNLDKTKSQDQAILNLLRSFKRVEVEWGRFYTELATYLHETLGKGEDLARLASLNYKAAELRPTRVDLFYLNKGVRQNTTSSKYQGILRKQLIEQLGLVEERRNSTHRGLLRLTRRAF